MKRDRFENSYFRYESHVILTSVFT